MKIIKKEEKLFLKTEYTTGNKAWAAKIVGSDPKWKFRREFLNKQRGGIQISPIQEGDIIEEVVYSHSGKNRSENYFLVKNGGLEEITEKEVIMSFL
jgi:hypothetical protein